MISDPVIFREYDIRGVFNEQFDNDFAFELGKAFITYVSRKFNIKNPNVTIGQDARKSSVEIVEALARGISSCGGNVKKLGLVTTPICYFSTFTLEGINGGIMVTGSHNPPEYNGFKISVGSQTIHGQEIKSLESLIEMGDYISNGSGRIESYDILPSYIERYKKEFSGIKKIKVVVDCGNGAAGSIVRKMYESVGLDPIILFEEPDGNFPNHHPDPTVEENLVDLANKVREVGAVLGIGFDGDADRIGIVDQNGEMILGDEIIALCASDILKSLPGAKIIGDVKCSDQMYDFIRRKGGEPIMWKTGHSLIKDKVRIENAPFGGELSGHVFFADRNYGYDDAPYAGLRVIEILAKEGKFVKDLLDIPETFNTPEIRLDTTEESKHLIVDAVKKHFEQTDYKVNLIDGIRVSYPDGWSLVRASNTQPVVVLRFESSTREGLKRIQNEVESIVLPLV